MTAATAQRSAPKQIMRTPGNSVPASQRSKLKSPTNGGLVGPVVSARRKIASAPPLMRTAPAKTICALLTLTVT
jgi:hypothetical protein